MEAGPGNQATPHWRSLYEAAVLELDCSKMALRIDAAERAITKRIEELNPSSYPVEAQQLMNALTVLRDLRRMDAERGWEDGEAAP